VVAQPQQGEEEVQVGGREKNCIACAGRHMMKQSECQYVKRHETWKMEKILVILQAG
jgi:hypothetical protein